MCTKGTTAAAVFAHAAATVLASGIVIDKSKSDKLSATELADLFHRAYTQNKPVVIVESAHTFFTTKNLFTMLETGDTNWCLVTEHFKIEISPVDIMVITDAIAIRKRILESVKGIKPDYEFGKIPDNWNSRAFLDIGPKSAGRHRGNSEGDGTQYKMTLTQLRRLWDGASRVWAGHIVAPHRMAAIRHDYTERQVVVGARSIQVGCQTIRRYELEALAVNQEWPFPEA